jgi:hypothetical protein
MLPSRRRAEQLVRSVQLWKDLLADAPKLHRFIPRMLVVMLIGITVQTLGGRFQVFIC